MNTCPTHRFAHTRCNAPACHSSTTCSASSCSLNTYAESPRSLSRSVQSALGASSRARFDVENPDGQLRPGMYGTAEFETATRDAIVVPRDAVVDTGVEQHVFVVEGDAMLVPRVVSLGVRLDERVEVTDGLREGEQIVAAGVFLIDSESRLRASGGAGAGHAHGAGGARSDANGATDSASRGRAPRGAPQPSPGAGHEGHEAPAATGARSAPRPLPRPPEPPSPSAHGGHGGTP